MVDAWDDGISEAWGVNGEHGRIKSFIGLIMFRESRIFKSG